MPCPAWMLDQVVYEIFPDRFAIGGGRTSEQKLALPVYASAVHRRWTDEPLQPARGNDFFGGDLGGVVDKLGYLKALGVGTIYLTPVFTAPSNHKYDAVDYQEVDPQFGGDAEFGRLLREAHGCGMRVVLDVSINHVSDCHPWFRAALRGEEPYRDWFVFDECGTYQCWRDHRHMPELDLTRGDVRAALFEEEDSVVQRWLARGADGWRLDVSPDLGLNISATIRAAVERRFPEAVLVGEVWTYGADWVGRGGYHATMNYFFRDMMIGWLHGEMRGRQVASGLMDAWRDYGAEGMLASWNMLSSHDTPRLRNVLTEQWQRWLALVAQFTLPGVPLIYYGEEVGMSGGADPGCRGPMPWASSQRDEGLLHTYRSLTSLRAAHRALSHGKLLVLSQVLDEDALVFLRHTDVPGEAALIALNPSEVPLRRRILVPYSHLYHALPLRDLLHSAPALEMESGSVWIEVPPRAAAVWVPDAGAYRSYSFFKPHNR